MGLLSLSNLAICIKKSELSGFKAYKMIRYPKFNLGQLSEYKLMFTIELSTEKRMIHFLAAAFSVFIRDKCIWLYIHDYILREKEGFKHCWKCAYVIYEWPLSNPLISWWKSDDQHVPRVEPNSYQYTVELPTIFWRLTVVIR